MLNRKLTKIVFFSLFIGAMSSICVGCGDKGDNTVSQSKKTVTEVKETTEVPEENAIEYAKANYFNEELGKVSKVIYYNRGNQYEMAIETEEAKKILELIEERFENNGEQVTKENILETKVPEIKKESSAIEIVFDGKYNFACEGSKINDFKNISMDVESWFFPIEGEYVDKFTNYPDSKYTFEKLGNANKLNEYLSNTDFGKYAK